MGLDYKRVWKGGNVMREIKFRAWDKRQKIMFGCWSLTDLCEQDGFHHTDLEFMQYTGLKDKNGVEIYEKDVVSYSEHYIGDHRYSAGRGVVEFDNGSFFINESEFSPELCREEIENEHIEIIGNIYENPELVDK